MASTGWRQAASLADGLRSRPAAFDFFQAVRILEARTHASDDAEAEPGLPVGQDHPVAKESVRFRSVPSLAFPGNPIRAVHERSSSPTQVDLTFMGAMAPSGILPPHYTELALDRLHGRDRSLRDFLDVFHHRALSLFFRAWRKYHVPFEFEHQARSGGEDVFTTCVRSLVGRSGVGLQQREAFDDFALFYYSGHFARRPGTASGLASVLSGFFDIPIRIEQFVGRWIEIPRHEQSTLGGPNRPHNQLGGGVALGRRSWDVTSKLRIHAEDIDRGQFERVKVGTDGHNRLAALAAAYLDVGLDFDLRVRLKPGAAPTIRLGSDAGSSLGIDAWLGAARPNEHVCEAVFDLKATQ